MNAAASTDSLMLQSPREQAGKALPQGGDALPRVRAGQQRGPTWSSGGVVVLFALAFLLSGCVSKSKADAQARMAYLAGQQAAFMQMQQQQARGPGVTFIGPVQNPFVKWSEGLTLSQAIVSAVYTAPTDPGEIIIRRNGQQIQFDPKQLLRRQDLPLEAGDIIELQQ
jgi:hypothetical protein